MRPTGSIAWRSSLRLKSHLVRPPLSWFARPIYSAAVQCELIVEGARSTKLVPYPRSDVTAIVKTFERPRALGRVVRSLARVAPRVHVVVADDSATPGFLPGVETVVLPFNVGVSAGRRAALARVDTPFVLNLDDDFVLHRGTCLTRAVEYLERNGSVDLLGGTVINLPFYHVADYASRRTYRADREPVVPIGSEIDGLRVQDVVPNFFIARTDRLRAVNWDPEIKRLDHTDFFTRARGVLTSVAAPWFSCLHIKSVFDERYQAYRRDYASDKALLARRYGR